MLGCMRQRVQNVCGVLKGVSEGVKENAWLQEAASTECLRSA